VSSGQSFVSESSNFPSSFESQRKRMRPALSLHLKKWDCKQVKLRKGNSSPNFSLRIQGLEDFVLAQVFTLIPIRLLERLSLQIGQGGNGRPNELFFIEQSVVVLIANCDDLNESNGGEIEGK